MAINPLAQAPKPPAALSPLVGTPLTPGTTPAAAMPGTAMPGASLGGTPQEALKQVLQMILMVIMAMVQGDTTGASLPQIGPGQAVPATGVVPPGAAPPPAAAAGGPLRIAQIDSFSGDHGNEIAGLIKKGGTHPDLVGNKDVDLLQYDIGNGSSQKINDSLNDIITRVQKGERIDAVNMSLQDFTDNGASQETRGLVDKLISMGIPVAVAAGNDGPGAQNFLEGMNSFNVESFTGGKRNATSGLGNVHSEGSTTSYATANLTPLLASLHAQGMSLDQIRAYLAKLG